MGVVAGGGGGCGGRGFCFFALAVVDSLGAFGLCVFCGEGVSVRGVCSYKERVRERILKSAIKMRSRRGGLENKDKNLKKERLTGEFSLQGAAKERKLGVVEGLKDVRGVNGLSACVHGVLVCAVGTESGASLLRSDDKITSCACADKARKVIHERAERTGLPSS